jgi:cyclohexa-1,5-dienecarbonyl-CoA hydratase
MTAAVRTIEEADGAWVRLVLDRPPGNLLSIEMVRGLDAALEQLTARQLKWVTLEGAGAEFSFGARIQEHVPGPMEEALAGTLAVVRRLLGLRCPTAALVRGRCLGGAFELALACDIVISEEGAALGLPEIALAAFPPAAAALLPLRAGATRTAEAIVTGVARSAAEWRERGIVSEVTGAGSLLQAAGQWFDRHLSPRSAVALASAAEASRLLLRSAAEPVLERAHAHYLERVLHTADAAEGVAAFLEKREPRWSNR